MNLTASTIEPVVSTLFFVLIHSLWQATAIAVGLLAVLALLRKHPAHSRYLVAVAALGLTAAAPLITWIAIAPSQVPEPSPVVAHDSDLASLGMAHPFVFEPEVVPQAAAAPSAWTTAERWTVIVWLAGVALMLLRLSLGWCCICRLKRTGSPVDAAWESRAASTAEHLGLRKVPPVLLSTRVAEAMVVGVFRPVILLPASWMLELPPETLQNVLAHELAHVRRWDPLVNGLQRGVEALLFYHPAVWWMSRTIRDERELCCDALAVQVTGQPVAYARTLELVGRRQLGLRTPAWATGMGDRQMKLLKRVQHVLHTRNDERASSWLPSMLTVAVVLTGIAVYRATIDQPTMAFADDVPDGERAGQPERERERDRERPRVRERDGDRERRDGDRPRDGDRERARELPPDVERMVHQMRREMAELREQLARERRRNEELQRALRGRDPESPFGGPPRRPDRDIPRERNEDREERDVTRPRPERDRPPLVPPAPPRLRDGDFPRDRDVTREERDVNRPRPESDRSLLELPGPPRFQDGIPRPPTAPELEEFRRMHERQLREMQERMEELNRFREEHERRMREFHERFERLMREAPGRRQWDRKREEVEREERREREQDRDRRERDRPRDADRERDDLERDEAAAADVADPFRETRDENDPAANPETDEEEDAAGIF